MKNILTNNLVDRSKPFGCISFIHFRDGSTKSFYSVVNEMSGNRLSAFGNNAPDIDDPVAWAKSVFRDIHKKATKVISCEGNLCPECNKKAK